MDNRSFLTENIPGFCRILEEWMKCSRVLHFIVLELVDRSAAGDQVLDPAGRQASAGGPLVKSLKNCQYMYTDPKVQITKVANGFLVNLKPDLMKEPSEFLKTIPNLVNQVLKSFNTGQDPDISDTQEPEEEEHSAIWIFKTWKEVAGFLQLHFEK